MARRWKVGDTVQGCFAPIANVCGKWQLVMDQTVGTMLAILSFFAGAAVQPVVLPQACVLDGAARRANASLSFEDFDQRGTLSTTWRRLGELGCWHQAADALMDYLRRGPSATPSQKRVMHFHIGQALAMAGDHRRAADFVALAREPSEVAARRPLNWNGYVQGTWAFLAKDRAALISARDSVLAGPGSGNANNGALLAGMERCFGRPYVVAYSTSCGR